MISVTHSGVKMTSAGGSLDVCSIIQVLSRSFHKHVCSNVVALLSQCILLQRSSKGNWDISEMLYENCQLSLVAKRYRPREY